MGQIVENIWKKALDLLFPPRCPLCGEISDGICENCEKQAQPVRQPFCYRCGRPVPHEDEEFCSHCRQQSSYRQGRSLYVYEGAVKKAVYAVKYSNKREYIPVFAREMARILGGEVRRWNPQAVIPIPMEKASLRKRGYNQAELLAKYFAEEMGLELCAEVLQKIKKTPNQKELSYRERRQNLKGAFGINRHFLSCDENCSDMNAAHLPWRTVLLVDDVFTTGSTIEEAAAVLKRHGVENVYFVTWCTVPL